MHQVQAVVDPRLCRVDRLFGLGSGVALAASVGGRSADGIVPAFEIAKLFPYVIKKAAFVYAGFPADAGDP